jgi:serine/threonine protein kinase
MPIEQMMGRPGFYSDIYALGVIAIQALTGFPPKELTIDDDGEIIWRNKLNPRVHYQPRFLDLLDKMVRYRHQERYSSASDVLADLRQLDAIQNDNKDTLIIPKSVSQPQSQPSQPVSNTNRTTNANVVNSQPTPIKQPIQQKAVGQTTVINNSNNFVKFPQPNLVSPVRKSRKSRKSKFKILSLLLISLLALVTALGGWILVKQRIKEPRIALAPYENYSQGFRVDYPRNWSKQNRDDFLATGAVFFSPLENDADQFKEQVSVLVEDLSSDLPLSEYTRQSLAEIRQLSDPNIGEAKVVAMGANEGRQIIYQGEENGNPVQRMQTWSVNGNRAYVITYTAVPKSYDDYLPTVEKIIESFETIE